MHPIIINNICWNDLWRIQRERCFSVLLSRCTRREEFHFCLGYAWIVKQADTVDVVADGTARLQNTFQQNSEIIPPNTPWLNRLQERTTHQEPIIHVIVRIQLLLNFHSGRIYHICNQQTFFLFVIPTCNDYLFSVCVFCNYIDALKLGLDSVWVTSKTFHELSACTLLVIWFN